MSLRRCIRAVRVGWGLLPVALATACASEPAVEPAGPISVALSSDTAVLPAGGRKDFTVTVANDQGRGVTW
ncbi:MAG TPA: hypothetical protein VF890_03105, partial [Gemmatimonadales bacterium]